MQALQTHLNPQPAAMQGQGAHVHGMNAPIRDDYSFDTFLQKEMNEQTSKAKEGPPENRNSVSDSTKPDTASKPDVASEKAHTEKEKTAQSEESKSSEKVGEKDASSKEKERILDTENSDDLLQLPTFVDASVSLANEEKKLQDASTTMLVSGKLGDDEQVEDGTTDSDDVLLAALSGGNLNTTELVGSKKSFAMNVGDDANAKLDALEASKKSKQVLAEIPTINVQDERTVSAEGKTDGNFVNSISYDGNGNATIDVSVNPNGANVQNTAGAIVNADGSVQQHTATNAQQFGTMLSSEIQSNSSELVKSGSIVLKDGNQGTINIILHPEELGNVKIRLEISDNILSGRITVASEEAYNAFKENLASLRNAFIAEGFDTAGFDLTWSGQENGQAEQEQKEGQSKNPFGNRYDDNIAMISDDAETEGDYNSYGSRAYINVMA